MQKIIKAIYALTLRKEKFKKTKSKRNTYFVLQGQNWIAESPIINGI